MTSIEKSKEDARNLNELTDHLTKLIESDDRRFSFEFCVGVQWRFTTKKKKSVMPFTLHRLNMMKMEMQQIYSNSKGS